jgi:hypothetical protein
MLMTKRQVAEAAFLPFASIIGFKNAFLDTINGFEGVLKSELTG